MSAQLDLLIRSLEAWNRHDLNTYRELYAPDAQIHGLAPGPIGVDAALAGYRAFFDGFPALHLSVEETICEADRIAVRFTIRGVHQGAWQGIPPTGRAIEVQGITTLRYAAGRVVERWNQLDQLTLLQQLGVMPAPVGPEGPASQ
jgi:steroid delta-isomerase-like uncharacterized protein